MHALHTNASDRSIYLRFFSLSRATADEYVASLVRPSSHAHHALVATVGGEIVGVAAFEGIDPQHAEIGLLVADDRYHDGIGTLLLEHLASIARHGGIGQFVAEVLAENAPMTEVLRNIGFDMTTTFDHGTIRAELDLLPTERMATVIGDRELSADAASLRALLAPRSVAVIGASPREGSVGNRACGTSPNCGVPSRISAPSCRVRPACCCNRWPDRGPSSSSVRYVIHSPDRWSCSAPAAHSPMSSTTGLSAWHHSRTSMPKR
jgi:GNAT superfamily N-acetyltransferase